MPFKRIYSFAAVCVLLLCCATAAAAAQVIDLFDSKVAVTRDGDLDVNETIVMDFGDEQRHGIYRMMPVAYVTKRAVLRTPTHILEVTADGDTANYSTAPDMNNLVIKIGDPYKTISGRHVYKLHYQVTRAINFFDGQPEIYWNATGNETQFPISSAKVEFMLPDGVDSAQVRAKCFKGIQGSKEIGSFQIKDRQIDFRVDGLAPMEGLTFVVRLPKDSVSINGMTEFMWWFKQWWPAVLTPWLVLILMLTNWWYNGRDPANAYIAGVDWNPPKELTPAEVGTLIDESCDVADIVSTLVDLASRGYLKIKHIKTEKFFFSGTNYEFIKLPMPEKAIPFKPFERVFYAALFSTGDIVRLSDLKYNFYTYIPQMKQLIYESLAEGKYFVQNPETVRHMYRAVGTVIMLMGVLLTFKSPAWAFGVGISGFIVLMGSSAMPSRTSKGVAACRQSLGFKRFVQKAEKERIRVLAKDDPTIFGRLLPYAMVLGAADHWASVFHDILTVPPDWYEPYGYGTPNFTFSSLNFVNDLGDGMRTCASTFTAVPASAPSSGSYGAASGSSGFSDFGGGGGGGFSGGGFGGGGVGSW